jgi:hypothetical protein
MAIYTQQPRRIPHWDQEAEPKHYPEAYSIAEIVFMDGTKHEFMVKASPSVVPHLVKEMKNTGYLTLWNDSDTLCIRADQVKHFSMREVTTK